VTINETWRTTKQELWTTQRNGHIFAGSGYEHGSRGVAFLIHHARARRIRAFTPVDERIAFLDIDIHSWKLRIITAYFPHTGYSDACVQRMYDTLSTIISEGRKAHLHIILAGDFNAQVGKRGDDDHCRTIGNFGMEPANSRGEWLTTWANSQHLILTNTYFDKPVERIATYVSPTKQLRQLDYVCTDSALWKQTRDAQSTTCPDLGSDHYAVQVRFDLATRKPNHNKRQTNRQRHPMPTWPPHDYNAFRKSIDIQLTNASTTNSLDERCTQLKTVINQALGSCSTTTTTNHTTRSPTQHDGPLQQLIQRR